ncbi:unnamed protein product [Prunus armeniaca]|uniref:Uncharacterized protein n=1 Tax=Prunus armeniaca TaxID=36596 RepID=A0A6J5U0L9_PRUAR|nr:unnamed protein product [Prunus armeniaca]
MARNLVTPNTSSSSTSVALSSLWLALWKVGVPLKSKYSNGTCAQLRKHNISKKQVSLDPTCVFCVDGCESTVHLLCDCIFAEGVWHCLSSFNYNKVYHSELAKEWVHSHRYLLSPADFATFLMLGWAIWEVKNALVWEAKQSRPEQVYINAVTRLQDFLKVNTRAPKSVQQPIGGVK